jgi:glycine cleavage system H protein
MTTLYYTKDHEWINAENPESAVVGITVHAQDALGDVVFVELPEVGSQFAQGRVAGVVESVKAAADLYMPVTGEVVAINNALLEDPSLANTAPLDKGWFFKIKVTNSAELTALMDSTAYDALLKNS